MRSAVVVLLSGMISMSVSLPCALPAEERPYQLGSSDLVLMVPSTWIASTNVQETTQDTKQDGQVMSLVLRSPLSAQAHTGLLPEQRQAESRARGVVSVIVQDLAGVLDRSVFAARCRTDLQRLMTSFVVIGEDQQQLGAHAWTRLSYTFHVGRFTWQQQAYSTVIGSTGYCITCSSEATSFAQWRPAFDAIITSLEHSRPALVAP
jgi:hypothetical protein